MKSLILGLILSLAFGTSANATRQEIPASQFPTYKRAVIVAIEAEKYDCEGLQGSPTGDFVSYVRASTSGEIDITGMQPLIIFRSQREGRSTTVSVTTSNDMKRPLSISLELTDQAEVNTGDLRSPKFEKIWQITASGVCDIVSKR